MRDGTDPQTELTAIHRSIELNRDTVLFKLSSSLHTVFCSFCPCELYQGHAFKDEVSAALVQNSGTPLSETKDT